MRLSHFFIDRPVFAAVIAILITLVGRDRLSDPAGRAVSGDRAADGERHRHLSRAPRPRPWPTPSPRRSRSRSTASRTCSTCPRSRPATATSRSPSPSSWAPISNNAQVLVENRVATATPRLPPEVRRHRRDGAQELAATSCWRCTSTRRTARSTSSTSPTTSACTSATRCCACRASATSAAAPRATTPCASGSIRTGPRRATSPSTTSSARCAATTSRSPPARSAQPPFAPGGSAYQLNIQALGRLTTPAAVRRHHRQDRRPGPRRPGSPTWRGSSWARPDYTTNAYMNEKPRRGPGHPAAARLQRADRPPTAIKATMERLKKSFPPGLDYQIIYNPTEYVSASIDEVVQDPVRGPGPGGDRGDRSSCRPGARRSSRSSPSRSR